MEEERKIKINKQIKMLLALKIKRDDPYPAEIIPGLFIGSIGAALNLNFLEENHFTHILTVADGITPSFPDKFIYKNLEILDTISFNILNAFDEAVEFINQAIINNGKVLVHCFAGRSRSSAVCCAYLIKKQNINLETALKHIIERRPCVKPNPGFLFQLQLYEKSFLALDLTSLN